jgi:hypothetical protein
MVMEKHTISYSSLLIDFIAPLITGQEDEHEFLEKVKLGQIAWNFSVSDNNHLPYDDIHKTILLSLTERNSNLKDILNKLVARKELKYSQHNQFIFKVELRRKKTGEKTLYVESAPAKWIKKD